MTDRGQSEILGYVIVFSIIVASVGYIYMTGFPALQNSQQAMATDNVENAFEVMDDNIRDITREGAPSRATEVRIAGGRLYQGTTTEIELYAEDTGDPDVNVTINADTSPVIYRDDADRIVTYAGGAIIRGNGTASVMTHQPDWVFSDKRTIVPLYSLTNQSDSTGISGETTVLLVTHLSVRSSPVSIDPHDPEAVTINISIESNRIGAWRQYLSEKNESIEGGRVVDSDPSDKRVYWQFNTSEVHTIRKRISLEIDQ